jgi:hypothetical protein
VNKLALLVALLPAVAFAEPSPYGTSPFVVAYQPPPKVDRAHRGVTLELALGGGTTSVDKSTGGITFALGFWISHDVSLAFRYSHLGAFQFVGGSGQYYATKSLWLGAGVGQLSESFMDEYGGTDRDGGTGGFLRAGYNIAGSGTHALYVSGELQAGQVDDQTRAVALVAIGYQML